MNRLAAWFVTLAMGGLLLAPAGCNTSEQDGTTPDAEYSQDTAAENVGEQAAQTAGEASDMAEDAVDTADEALDEATDGTGGER
jgi:hypothetical protein